MNGNSQSTVLVVDDEDIILSTVRAVLQIETDHRVECFSKPREALKYLEANMPDAVVSDYLMPEMNGIQFLTRARHLRPEAPRILLTGHSDKQSAVQAINDVGLFHYLEKPWENPQLVLTINNAVEKARLYKELRDKMAELSAANSSLKDVQVRLLKAFL